MEKKLKFSLLIVAGILCLALLWPLVYAPYFSHQDDVQTIRLYEMNQCIKDGQIPCRWVPDLGGEYGYPLFNYYAPLPYYTGEIFYLITSNLIFSAKMMFAISFIGSSVFMFLCGRKLWGYKGGIISAVFYSYAPYHAVDFYVRGAMGELWAIMFYPAIIWGVIRLKERTSVKNSVILGLCIAGLMLSHNLSTLIFMPFVALYGLVICNRKYNFLGLFGLSILIGIMLAAFYWIPAYTEKSYAHLETTIEGYFSYTEHFKGLQKLFVDRYWGYGSSVREIPGQVSDNQFPYQIGWIHILGWILALFSGFILWKKNRFLSKTILLASFAIVVSVFMINPKSELIWRLVDPLKYLQFPWRFLMIIIFFISLIAGSAIYAAEYSYSKINKQKLTMLLFILLGVSVVVFNFFYFKPEKFYYITDKDLLTGNKWDQLIKRSIFDFLPIYAKAPPADLATSRYQIITGDAKISNYKQGSDWITFDVHANQKSIIRLSQYYFPNWVITVDNKKTPIDYDNFLGLMTFTIDPGSHEVNAHLYNTPIRSFSNLLTILGILLILVLLLKKKIVMILRSY